MAGDVPAAVPAIESINRNSAEGGGAESAASKEVGNRAENAGALRSFWTSVESAVQKAETALGLPQLNLTDTHPSPNAAPERVQGSQPAPEQRAAPQAAEKKAAEPAVPGGKSSEFHIPTMADTISGMLHDIFGGREPSAPANEAGGHAADKPATDHRPAAGLADPPILHPGGQVSNSGHNYAFGSSWDKPVEAKPGEHNYSFGSEWNKPDKKQPGQHDFSFGSSWQGKSGQ